MEKKKTGMARLFQIAGKRKRLLTGSAILAILHALLSIVPYLLVYLVIQELLAPPINNTLIRTYIGWTVLAVITNCGAAVDPFTI